MKMIYLSKKPINSDKLLEQFDDKLIFEQITGYPFKTGYPYSAPYRSDKNPSFIFGLSKNRATFKDLSTGETGDCIALYAKINKLSYGEAVKELHSILIDKKRSTQLKYQAYIKAKELKEKNKSDIKEQQENQNNIKFITTQNQPFSSEELAYWSQYNISLKILQDFNVNSVKSYLVEDVNGRRFYYNDKNELWFVYNYGDSKCKLYFPFSSDIRFKTNSKSIENYYKALSLKEDYIIITKSYKDVMCLTSLGYFSCICPPSESSNISSLVLKKLKSIYNKIYILYDNDKNKDKNYGQINAKKIMEKLKVVDSIHQSKYKNISIPDNYKSKDISDMVKDHGVDETLKFLKSKIK